MLQYLFAKIYCNSRVDTTIASVGELSGSASLSIGTTPSAQVSITLRQRPDYRPRVARSAVLISICQSNVRIKKSHSTNYPPEGRQIAHWPNDNSPTSRGRLLVTDVDG